MRRGDEQPPADQDEDHHTCLFGGNLVRGADQQVLDLQGDALDTLQERAALLGLNVTLELHDGQGDDASRTWGAFDA